MPTNYPKSRKPRGEIDRKLGIKSSLKDLKPLFGLTFSLWLSSSKASELEYSEEITSGSKTQIQIALSAFTDLEKLLSAEISSITNATAFKDAVNLNPLFSNQLEPLLVCLELYWKISKIRFIDDYPNSHERKGGSRFRKRLGFTINCDIIDTVLSDTSGTITNAAKSLLVKWIIDATDEDSSLSADEKFAKSNVLKLLSLLTEDTHFKIRAPAGDLEFLQEGIYESFLDSSYASVDTQGQEDVGPFRIMLSSVRNGLHPYIGLSGRKFIFKGNKGSNEFSNYSGRVTNYLDLIERKTNISISIPPEAVEDKVQPIPDLKIPWNLILYGPPGTGKSRTAKIRLSELGVTKENKFSTTFHPDFDYADFVGKYKPISVESTLNGSGGSTEECIRYIFEPGIFLKAYVKALKTDEPVALVIEEINRGNCAGIFGDLFQLLDREESGISDYPVYTTEEIKNHLVSVGGITDTSRLKFPPNLFLIATMNTSDQSLFPMDSAFKRRWNWEYVPIDYDDAQNLNIQLGGSKYSWKSFTEIVNDKIYRITESEDKQLGNRFVNPPEGIIDKALFREKVLFYLWNDVFKHEDPESEHNIFRHSYVMEDGTESYENFKFSDLFYSSSSSEIISGFFSYHKIEKKKDTELDESDTENSSDGVDTNENIS